MIGLTIWRTLRNRLVGLIILMSVLLAAVSCGSAKITQESVVVKDTLVITKERVLHDTLTLFKDTTIYQDRVKLKIEYIDNFVKVEVDCPSDTIRVTQVKVVQAKQDKKMSWEGLAGWIIVILCSMVILRALVQKYL